MPLQLPAPVGCSQQHLLLRLGRGGLGWAGVASAGPVWPWLGRCGLGWLTRAAEGASLWIQIGGASP